MKKILLIALIGLLLTTLGIWAAVAQEAPKAPVVASQETVQAPSQPLAAAEGPQQPMPETKMAYGEVVTFDAAARMVTIKEYDYEADQYINAAYSIAADAKLEGDVAGLNDIKVSDFLDIEYKTEADKKIAIYLYVERPQAPTFDEEGVENTISAGTETEETE